MIEEEIRANRRKILTGKVVFLLYVAFYTCAVFIPLTFIFVRAAGAGGVVAILVSFTIWLVIMGSILYYNADIVRRTTGAEPLEEGSYPHMASAAEDIAIASGQKVPRLMLIGDEAINAFSMTSIRARCNMVFCTEGMARDLHLDEMRAIMAHELAHLRNGDAEVGSLIMPFNAVFSFRGGPLERLAGKYRIPAILLVLIIVILFLVPSMFLVVAYTSWSVISSDTLAIILVGLLLPLISLYLLSIIVSMYWGFTLRKREYLADETALKWTNFPEGMIGALLKAGERNTGSGCAFLDDASFAPPGGTRGLMDYQPSLSTRINKIREETYQFTE
jgi:Zn-dependent protease with chaperone function